MDTGRDMTASSFKKYLFLGLGFSLSLLQVASANELYKWTDDKGVIQYSQHPPKDRTYSTIRTTGVKTPVEQAPAAPTSAAETPSDADATATAEAKTGGKKPEGKSGEFLESKKKNCDIAKANKETLVNKARVAVRDAKGEQRILSEQEKADQVKLVDEQIKTYCN